MSQRASPRILIEAAEKFVRVNAADPTAGRGALYGACAMLKATMPPETPAPVEYLYRGLHALCCYAGFSLSVHDGLRGEIPRQIACLAAALKDLTRDMPEPRDDRPWHLKDEL